MEIAIAERARAATKTGKAGFTAETQNTQRFFHHYALMNNPYLPVFPNTSLKSRSAGLRSENLSSSASK
jgi:hypothetical protein